MKKIIGIASLVVLGLFGGQAAAQKTTTEGVGNEVTLNVILNPVRTLTVNQSEVNLIYSTAEHYAQGVSETIKDHLEVTSIGSGFKIYAKATADDLYSGGQALTKAATDGMVHVSAVGGNDRMISTMHGQNDDNKTYGVPIAYGNATLKQKFDVTYSAAGNDAYINSIIDKQKTTYTVNILYTIDTE